MGWHEIHIFTITLLGVAGIQFFYNVAYSSYFKKKHDRLLELLGDDYVLKKENVKCEIYKSGGKKAGFRFNRCDCYILNDGILLMGHLRFFGRTIYSSSAILKRVYAYDKFSNDAQLVVPTKINPDSIGHTVYIEFDQPGPWPTNVNIILKGLTDEERKPFGNLMVHK